ncbi:ABC transporter ATP-binding protein [Phytohabitans suffuscus]
MAAHRARRGPGAARGGGARGRVRAAPRPAAAGAGDGGRGDRGGVAARRAARRRPGRPARRDGGGAAPLRPTPPPTTPPAAAEPALVTAEPALVTAEPALVTAEPAAVAAAVPSGPAPVEVGAVLVECRNVARYFGGVRALEDVSLTVREGEIVGLVGPNGSGKTTLVSLLSGSLRPTRGSIHVAGNDLAGLPPHRVAHAGVARTYQIPRPFTSMTVRDNVAMAIMFGRSPRSLSTARRDAAGPLDVVGLGHLAGAYPDKLNLHQRQLLEIARALAADPKVLLLDEALAGLNPAEIDNAVEVIRRVHRSGVSIVIVEHLLRVVNQLATRIVVLDRGTRLADGDPREVLTDPAVVRAYLGKRAHA